MAALVAAAAAPDFPAQIVLVASSRPHAPGLGAAAAAGIATAVIDHASFAARPSFETALTAALEDSGADLVCLAGFMRRLTPDLCERWAGRLINIHPSLLPAFKGLDTHARALAAGVRIHGCTVHFVTPELDSGPIIAQAAVPVLQGDTAESLGARVLAAEHQLYPHALALVASGRARIAGARVCIDGPDRAPSEGLFSPPLA